MKDQRSQSRNLLLIKNPIMDASKALLVAAIYIKSTQANINQMEELINLNFDDGVADP